MQAAIVAVGSELLGRERLDTNSLRLTALLERFGVVLVGKSVVADDEARIADELRRRASEVDLVLVTGGLGPTADDVTRAAAAQAFDRQIEIDESLVEELRQRFASFGRRMADVNRKQAEVISGAELLQNPMGTAPGWRLMVSEAALFLFPGVPRELEAMIESALEPWLLRELGAQASAVERGVAKVACRPESEIEQRLLPLYERFDRHDISVLASPGDIKIYYTARGSESERGARLTEMREALRELLGYRIYGEGEGDTLESVVGAALLAAERTLTTAESCTGGLLAERLTRVAGSSGFFLGGVVSYSNQLKQQLLGVEESMIARHGAVSEPVARAMAAGARERLESDFGIGITGIAGPGGGTEEKPVGTVHIALAGPREGNVTHLQVRLPGDRPRVRQLSAQLALEMLRRALSTQARTS